MGEVFFLCLLEGDETGHILFECLPLVTALAGIDVIVEFHKVWMLLADILHDGGLERRTCKNLCLSINIC